ncbi:MAG: DinB family protein [Candidatus Tectomicrobia bacterium]|uniref:DinB family protein n=1 Tax=Tectimicrobiota bacterium TaxID=2528274 RepID=A0A938B1V8_UNCTE|nr:DinB family protein [Candidatus Tectomicrobia bacterium]
MDACDTCVFVYADVNAKALPERLAAFGRRYRERLLPLNQPPEWRTILRTRPATDLWSALEYACHLRDVFLMLRERLYTVLVEDKPVLASMYREQRVFLARYQEQGPEVVTAQLATAAQLLAQAFAVLDDAQLARLCVYPFPRPSERPLLWVGQHAVHEGEHHLRDIASVLTRVRAMQ